MKKRILFVLPNRFAGRNILESDIPEILGREADVRVTFVSLFEDDEKKVAGFAATNLDWRNLRNPLSEKVAKPAIFLKYSLMNLGYKLLHLLFLGRGSHDALFYRFHQLNDLFIHHWWKQRTKGRWRRGSKVQRKLVDRKLARPLPRSKRLYDLLTALRFWSWGCDYRVEAFMEQEKFDLVVFNFVQTSPIFPYITAARRRHVPTIGIVGSWDNPTTKGGLYPCSLYVVQNEYMAEKVKALHRVDDQRLRVTGWPQMDIYKKGDVLQTREDFFREQGLEPDCRLILFGLSTKRFGAHEPGVIRHLLRQGDAGIYGDKVAFILRAHPGDRFWRQYLDEFSGRESVVVEPPNYHDRVHLVNLLHHADIVISTAGTISLDAVAFDTNTISVVFDGDLDPGPADRVANFYRSEHYSAVLETGGTRAVYSFEELDRAIVDYLDNPSADAEGRRRLRKHFLEPFDGKASARLAEIILH